jgi:glucose-6-phosphate 1-dehydrogenase
VQYRDAANQQRYDRTTRTGADAREAFRGRAESGRQELARGGADGRHREHGTPGNYFYYLATAPGLFAGVINQLGMAGLTHVLEPILDVWKALPPRNFPKYAAGTWGPKEADELIGRNGRQ